MAIRHSQLCRFELSSLEEQEAGRYLRIEARPYWVRTVLRYQELVLEVFLGVLIMSQTFSAVSSFSASMRRRSISFSGKSTSRFLLKNEQ